MKRRYAVDLYCTVEIEVDDEAVSDWDGSTILTAHQNPERFGPDRTRDDVIGALAIVVGAEGRKVGGTDGWADWPDGTVTAVRWPEYDVERVVEVTP